MEACEFSKLCSHALSELVSKKVPPTNDSLKYNYRAACEEGDGSYSFEFCEAQILIAFSAAGALIENVKEGEQCSLILDRTCFYAEQGGQIYDQGYIILQSEKGHSAKFCVKKVFLQKGYILHQGVMVEGSFKVGDVVMLYFDVERRRFTMSNHTATHILDHALLVVLGPTYYVKSSLVTPERLQLDFLNKTAMTAEQIRKAESIVIDFIKRNVPVYTMHCKLEDAKKIIGLQTLANVDYPDPARVVSVGEPIQFLIENPQSEASLHTSVDFCGGTHVHRSGHIGQFVISSEETLSKGFRRIIALTGPEVDKAIREAETLKEEIRKLVDLSSTENNTRFLRRKWTELMQVVCASVIPYIIKDDIKKQLNEFKKIVDEKERKVKLAESANIVQEAEDLLKKYSSASFMVESLNAGSNKEALDTALKKVHGRKSNLCIMLFSADEESGKIFSMCTVSSTAVAKGLTAHKWIQGLVALMNGKGGGNPKWAQASGSNFTELRQIIDKARRIAAEHLEDESINSSKATVFNAITSILDVYHIRNLITKQFSSQSNEQSHSLNCNAVSYYLCDESFKGGTDVYHRATVLQWIYFADSTLWPTLFSKSTSPEFNAKEKICAKSATYLEYLHRVLETRTFLAYHKLSLADIAVFTCLLPLFNSDTNLEILEKEYVNVYRWFLTVYRQPHISNILLSHFHVSIKK